MNQTQLADVSGVPKTTISGIINDSKIPNLVTASKLAMALGIHAEDLMGTEVKN